MNILGLVGLRPITIDSSDLVAYLWHIQTIIIVFTLSTGYFIQYFSYFRWDLIVWQRRAIRYISNANNFSSFSRDRGFTNTTYPPIELSLEFYSPRQVTVYYGETIFVYGVSSVLHFFGFLSAIYVFRIADNEQLQNLVERVFILHTIPNKLIYILWSHFVCGLVWLTLMTAYLIVMEDSNIDVVKMVWFGAPTKSMQTVARALLVSTTFVQDFIQVIVLTSYSLQCYLLRRYVYVLKIKLLQNTIDTLDWMRVNATV